MQRSLKTNPIIKDPFWTPRLEMNATEAVFHQWQQLEKTGCIQNFRLVADQAKGVRLGFFFADSDAYKWLEAAARSYATHPSLKLKKLMDEFIDLIGRTQTEDGYIYTYNQFFFPELRWQNLQIEHELYCHGHLIEAAASHFQATGERTLLQIAIKAADLLVDTFLNLGPQGTPGHQEIEIALIRLYGVTEDQAYLNLAEHFIEQRGRIKPFITHILAKNKSFGQRNQQVSEAINAYLAQHPEYSERYSLPTDNFSQKPPLGHQRWFLNMATGKYFQQHKPVRKQTLPVGHAVRFAYFETAAAMLYLEREDETLRQALVRAWDHMVMRRMYVTGGVGALPNIEGFGRDYELDPFYSYSETCASLGVIFWNWQMARITGEAKYADLTEWQFYNGAAVGLGQDGTSYLYNNPLSCRGDLYRRSWFKCPCCPSNISRTWADLGKYLFSFQGHDIWVQQYIGCEWTPDQQPGIRMESGLPWKGEVMLEVLLDEPRKFCLHLRIPGWSGGVRVRVNGEDWIVTPPAPHSPCRTASGYDPGESWYLPVERTWSPGDRVELEFEMLIRLRFTHPKVKATRGKAAVSLGPIVYCLESFDNPDVDIFMAELDPHSLRSRFSEETFGGIHLIQGLTQEGKPLTFLPYYLWANRGSSQMTVYVRTKNPNKQGGC